MKVVKPPRLKRGDVVGVVAPGSPASREKLEKGIRYLERLGYRVEVGHHVNERRGYLAGNDKSRANDFNKFFGDRKVRAIFATRGGYGSHRILPLLDFTTIRRNPKIVVGYSDITALQLSLYARTGLVTFSGPMVATDFGQGFSGDAEEQFWRCLTSAKPLGLLKNRYLSILRPGTARGRLHGGNLSLVASLLGSPYFPDLKNHVLVLEEIEEPPYKIDRMLNHLDLTRVLSACSGIVLGTFTNCHPVGPKKPSLRLNQVFDDLIASLPIPSVAGFHYGHVRNTLTLPLGINAELNATRRRLDILESAVA